MKRTTIFLDPALERDLRLHADRQGRSTASVVREALAQWVEVQRGSPAARPGFVAAGRSGRSDTAQSHEALLFAALDPHGSSVPPAGARRRAVRPRAARRSPRRSTR
jgi:hypothetical protein